MVMRRLPHHNCMTRNYIKNVHHDEEFDKSHLSSHREQAPLPGIIFADGFSQAAYDFPSYALIPHHYNHHRRHRRHHRDAIESGFRTRSPTDYDRSVGRGAGEKIIITPAFSSPEGSQIPRPTDRMGEVSVVPFAFVTSATV